MVLLLIVPDGGHRCSPLGGVYPRVENRLDQRWECKLIAEKF